MTSERKKEIMIGHNILRKNTLFDIHTVICILIKTFDRRPWIKRPW